ncbi:MAG: hypothetical protein LBU28_10805 [Spirochaetaceae bacterium]|jgi:hypothetical protein|nr:hypothetical protein [Spirochaetaceae bacterium]
MKIEKIVLDTMERCYAASSLTIDGRLYAVLASESIDGPCYGYTGDRFTEKEVIWEKAGGTMSLIQIPGSNGEFIAVQHFFPGFQSAGAKLVWGRRTGRGVWEIRDLVSLPYVHRFDLFAVGNDIYILAATLCGSKKDREDWSDPGAVYVGKLPSRVDKGVQSEGVRFTPVLEKLTKNHGYCRGLWEGSPAAFVTSDEGIFVLSPPHAGGTEWKTRRLLDRPVGDVAVCDLDGDGVDELVTIEPFHGNQFVVNKRASARGQEDGYEIVYRYPGELDFAHAVVGCTLRGKPAVIGGVRRKHCELFILTWNAGRYEAEVVEQGIGPSNVAVVNGADRDIIISANHTQNQAAIYLVRD